ncbi:MAG: metalloregulator ArsR/SmtB family transcription factor [Alphaproteobacteria bacterium]|uniref:Metalloregulator ArsR/SmtB family transcription factor n=1 Tax=Candidatus Nitrobium versatile TaxID=2884831 RepID=A0A953M3J7_9BACT|nr:metalloregulator ArsR/SmtB family transcription factor [Candidatus Nitrobium versatile]
MPDNGKIPISIENLARTLKVLGDPNRLNIVLSIGKGTCSVTEIINATGLSQTLVSFHLKTLRDTSIVTPKRNGPFIYYRLTEPALLENLVALSSTINNLDPVNAQPYEAEA